MGTKFKKHNFELNYRLQTLDINLAKYLLPEGLLDYFDIVSDKIENEKVHFYLEEKNILPDEYKSEKAKSKGFIPEINN